MAHQDLQPFEYNAGDPLPPNSHALVDRWIERIDLEWSRCVETMGDDFNVDAAIRCIGDRLRDVLDARDQGPSEVGLVRQS